MSANEPPAPSGIDPEILAAALNTAPTGDAGEDLGCDAYALWATVTRLGHEVKLQGRAFAALREALEKRDAALPGCDADGLAAKIAAEVDRTLDVGREGMRAAERSAEAARKRAVRAEEDLLSALADVHDRLYRGLEAARKIAGARSCKTVEPCSEESVERKSWFKRWLPGGKAADRKGGNPGGEEVSEGVVRSLLEGQELALRRVADEMSIRGLREIAVLGERFNPETMRAVAVDPAGDVPEGTVTAVIRGGWMLHDEVWRTAEVMVSRHDGAEHS